MTQFHSPQLTNLMFWPCGVPRMTVVASWLRTTHKARTTHLRPPFPKQLRVRLTYRPKYLYSPVLVLRTIRDISLSLFLCIIFILLLFRLLNRCHHGHIVVLSPRISQHAHPNPDNRDVSLHQHKTPDPNEWVQKRTNKRSAYIVGCTVSVQVVFVLNEEEANNNNNTDELKWAFSPINSLNMYVPTIHEWR